MLARGVDTSRTEEPDIVSHALQLTDAAASPKERYGAILSALEGILAGERNAIANLANTSALLYASLGDLNWAGFYLFDGAGLVVGPFQGLPACVRIAIGQGVCGTAAARRETVIVKDVHEFPGHIACDAASNSEIVVPLVGPNGLIGVLDLDSPRVGRFSGDDAAGLEAVVARLLPACDW